MSELDEFHSQLIADVQGGADALGLVTVEAFFEKAGDLLTEAGEIDSANRAYFEGTVSGNPARIDGYGGDQGMRMEYSALSCVTSLSPMKLGLFIRTNFKFC